MGRDLVKAAETRAQIAQIEKYNSAVNTFYGKYGGLPGDLSVTLANQFGFDVVGCGGTQGSRDGNGLVDGWSAPWILDEPIGETGVFWEDLSSAKLIDGHFPNGNVIINGCTNGASSFNASTANAYFPYGKIGYGNYVYVYENNGSNYWGLSAISSGAGWGSIITTGNIPVIQAYNIDKKADDGLPMSGSINVAYVNGFNGDAPLYYSASANPDTSSTCYNSSTLQYSIGVNNGTNPNCGLSFRMISPGR